MVIRARRRTVLALTNATGGGLHDEDVVSASADDRRRWVGRNPGRSVLFAISVLFALAGGVCTWLAYPTPSMCAVFTPNTCDGDPRLAPAIIGTVMLAGLVVLCFVSGRSSRLWLTVVLTIVTILVAMAAPAATVAGGGFATPV